MICFVLCLTMALLAGTEGVQPGFQARITPKGLSFLTELGIRELKDEISKIPIPDISGQAHYHHIEKADYWITNMKITNFNFPSASIVTKPNVGVTISASGLSISIHGDWRYKLHGLIPVRDHGSFDASISSISLSMTIEIGVDKNGRPTVYSSSSDCSFNAGGASVHFHGGASWLYNLFNDVIEKSLKKSLNDQVCQMVVKEVNTGLAKEVASIKIVASLSKTVEVDYSLVAAPIINQSLTTQHKGEVYEIGNHTEAPYKIPAIPRDQDESRMLFMWVTDYLANSAGYVLQHTIFFQYNVTQDLVPAGSKFNLNTSDFAVRFLIPQLDKLYPDMMMQINLNTTAAPTLNIDPDNVSSVLNGDIAAYVIQPNKSLTYLFTLGATMKLSVKFDFKGSNLTWNITFVSADLKLLHSTIDNFKMAALRDALTFVGTVYIVPALNEFGAKGIPLPSFDDYMFTNPIVTQENGVLKIGTDLVYQPGWNQS